MTHIGLYKLSTSWHTKALSQWQLKCTKIPFTKYTVLRLNIYLLKAKEISFVLF